MGLAGILEKTKSKDITIVREVLCGHAQGLSLDRIRLLTGVPKTSVKRIIDQARATGLTIDELQSSSDEAITELLMPSRRARMNYVEPDWESVYLNCERQRKPLGLRVCWEQYCRHAQVNGRVMSYSTFCRAYNEYKQNCIVQQKPYPKSKCPWVNPPLRGLLASTQHRLPPAAQDLSVLTALKRLDHRSRGLRPTFEGERPREPWTSLHRGIFCANPRHLSCRNERLTMPLSRVLWTHPRKLWNATRKRLDFAVDFSDLCHPYVIEASVSLKAEPQGGARHHRSNLRE